jgi:hypothetical protein
MKSRTMILKILFLASWIASCTGKEVDTNLDELLDQKNNCIVPVTSFAYPTGNNFQPYEERQEVLPLSPWKEQAQIFEDTKSKSKDINSAILRRRNGYPDQIWLSYDSEGQTYIEYYDFLTKKTMTYIESSLKFTPKFIYSNDSGGIWGIVYDEDTPQNKFFVKFNDSTEDFEPASKQVEYYQGDITAITKGEGNSFWISLMVRDMQTGEKKYTFISLDSETLQSGEIPSVSKLQPTSLAFSQNKDVWMLILDNGRRRLATFNPFSKSTTIYEESSGIVDGFATEDVDDLSELYFDRYGRLWVDDRGWFDFSITNMPQWYRVVRSPVFIEKQEYSEVPYVWRRPFSMTQSSDGLYWFTSSVGTVRLDEASGEWCLFTTYISPIMEDSSQHLWMIADGKLFTYEVNP